MRNVTMLVVAALLLAGCGKSDPSSRNGAEPADGSTTGAVSAPTSTNAGVADEAGFAVTGKAELSLTFHPDAPVMIDVKAASMDKSWPNHGYPMHIGKPGRGGFVFVVPQIFGDRYSFYADEPTAQFFVLLPAAEGTGEREAVVTIKSATGKEVGRATGKSAAHRFSFTADIRGLEAGKYVAEASFAGDEKAKATWAFEKLAKGQGAIAFPADGVELVLEDQAFVKDASWPVVAGVPLPRGRVAKASDLAVYEDGKRIPADIYERGWWDPEHRSVKWVHVHFQGRYKEGNPRTYRLKRAGNEEWKLRQSLVHQSGDQIEVDTGVMRFVVNRKKFNGIDALWLNGQSAIGAAGTPTAGPYLVDQAGTRYQASNDGDVKVETELNGSAEATIAASGWYVADGGGKLCKFVTRISAYPGQTMLRVKHFTTLTMDTHQTQLADLGFELPVRDVAGFQFGADGKMQPAAADEVFVHQDRYDHYRTVGLSEPAEGGKLDGWFTLDRGDKGAAHLFVRDIWQKYPKEVGLSRGGFSLHFWPKHGHEAYPQAEQLLYRNLYKFLCFHQGALMDLRTPQAYLGTFIAYGSDEKSFPLEGSHAWWRESERDGTKSGNAQGVTIANEFALTFTSENDDDAPAKARLFLFDPTAHAPREWNCATQAMGDLAPPDDRHFTQLEEAIEQGWLSWARQVERYNEYGMFNYADTHTKYKVAENRPGLHRVWQGSHYRNIGTNWLLWYRSGSPALLRWARANTDHYMNIKTCNYVDAVNPVPVMDHELGAMQHMGWKTQWASSGRGEAWGQFRDVLGHFIDPEAPLNAWLMAGNRRGLENYDNWLATSKTKFGSYLWGQAREVNTTLAYLIGAYEATWDPTLLANIHSLGLSLRSTPLEKQQPGPLWHALWINRYYDLTRDPAYEPVIFKYAEMWTGVESSSTMGLTAKAYDINGDTKLMERFLPSLALYPRGYFRKPGDPYDWWGRGPGPLGDGYTSMLWGYFRARLERAGIKELAEQTSSRGGYPYTSARHTHLDLPASLTIYAVEEKDGPLTVKFRLGALGGSLHATSAVIYDTEGSRMLAIERLETGDDKNEPRTFEADGRTGVYRIEFRGHEASVPVPQTKLLEVAAIDGDTSYQVLSPRFSVQPRFGDGKVTLKIVDASDDAPMHYIVESKDGRRLGDGYLYESRGIKDAAIVLDPKDGPWTIDIVGKASVRFESEGLLKLLCGPDPSTIEKVAAYLEKNTLK